MNTIDTRTTEHLGFEDVRSWLQDEAASEVVKKRFSKLGPLSDETLLHRRFAKIQEVMDIMETHGSFQVYTYADINEDLRLLSLEGSTLYPEALENLRDILEQTRQLKKVYDLGEFKVIPFKTNHGSFAAGSVGYVIQTDSCDVSGIRLVYTSDFVDVSETLPEMLDPDYLIIQSFWLNDPTVNRPNHMSFQRALDFIELWQPQKETFLVHIGDCDMVPDDPANNMLKKTNPRDPLRPVAGGAPYPVPTNQVEWQGVVDTIMSDRRLDYKVTVAYDGLQVHI